MYENYFKEKETQLLFARKKKLTFSHFPVEYENREED